MEYNETMISQRPIALETRLRPWPLTHGRLTNLLSLSLAAWVLAACVPGTGIVDRPSRDAVLNQDGPGLTLKDGTAVTHDGTALAHDGTALVHDGTAVTHDGTAVTHDSTAVVHDTTAPKPDSPPPCLQPPFGTTVGVTAANFSGIPDCPGKKYDLHTLCNQLPAIVLALNKSS